jgi:hypothetical protein
LRCGSRRARRRAAETAPRRARIEALVTVAKPTHRIIHFRDYHFVLRELYAADLADALGRALPPDELDPRHRELSLQAELVTIEQAAVMRCLAQHHGLTRVLCEGLTLDGLPQFSEAIAAFRETEQRLASLRKRRAGLAGDAAATIDQGIAEIAEGHRLQLLPYGVAGRLAIDQVAEVLPLDDINLLAARPLHPDGRIGVESKEQEARHGSNVKAAQASGRVAVIVLGASHDLTAAVRRLGGGTAEYVQVTTAAVERFAGAR